jgi:hypothetical protein
MIYTVPGILQGYHLGREHFCLGANSKSSILSSAEQSGARIEGCEFARIPRRSPTLRYAFAALRLLRLRPERSRRDAIDIQIMFLGRGVPLRSPRWGRCKTYPYQIQNVFLKGYISQILPQK